jgi:hypothetical protein
MLKIIQAKPEEHLRDITQEEELTTENTEHTEKASVTSVSSVVSNRRRK